MATTTLKIKAIIVITCSRRQGWGAQAEMEDAGKLSFTHWEHFKSMLASLQVLLFLPLPDIDVMWWCSESWDVFNLGHPGEFDYVQCVCNVRYTVWCQPQANRRRHTMCRQRKVYEEWGIYCKMWAAVISWLIEVEFICKKFDYRLNDNKLNIVGFVRQNKQI